MKQTWRLIGRSVGTCLVIAHWEFLISLDACLDIVFIWDMDILIMMIDLYWLRILIPWFLLCFIDIFDWDIDMLDYWWLILLLCFCHDCSDHFTCIHSLLYIIRLDMLIHLLVYYFDHLWACCLCITIHLIVVFSFILCVCIDDISEICLIVCCMTTLLCVIACRLSVWVAHLSPYLPLSSLGHFLHSGSRFCKCETLCVLVLRSR